MNRVGSSLDDRHARGLLDTLFILATGPMIVPDVPVRVLVALAYGELIFSQLTCIGRFCAQARAWVADAHVCSSPSARR